MKVINILNLKGGVAKTTTAINAAAILAAEHGQRVLLIDGDSQCNTTEFFGADGKTGDLAEVLRLGSPTEAIKSIQRTAYGRLDLLPGDESLMDLDLSKVETGTAKAGVLRAMVQLLTKDDKYDWIITDCPPAFNAASAAALMAADEVVIPIKLDAFSLRGMGNLMRQIKNMRQINPGLKLGGLLPTMWYKSKTIMEAEQQLRASGLPVYSHIRRTPKVDEMTFAQEPVIASSPKSAAAADYRRFVEELIKGGAKQ